MFEININFKLSSISETLGSFVSSARDLGGEAFSNVRNLISDAASEIAEKASPYTGPAYTSAKSFLAGFAPEPKTFWSDPFGAVHDYFYPPVSYFESVTQAVANAAANAETGLSFLGHSITIGQTAVVLLSLYVAGKYILVPVAKKLANRATPEQQPPPQPQETAERGSRTPQEKQPVLLLKSMTKDEALRMYKQFFDLGKTN